MDVSSRRKSILEILCRRRFETIHNLAVELEVSERTIQRDVNTLSLSEPIYTQVGRYGGVYVVENFHLNKRFFTDDELGIMRKTIKILKLNKIQEVTEEDIRILQLIVDIYTKPKLNKR